MLDVHVNGRTVTSEELSNHNKMDDCWIVIRNAVYDVTQFLDSHPGGKGLLLAHAGADATTTFDAVHSELILNSRDETVRLVGTLLGTVAKPAEIQDTHAPAVLPLAECLNTSDFERAAEVNMSPTSYVRCPRVHFLLPTS